MSIIDKLSSGVSEAGNTITQKAKGISEQTKLSSEISKNKARREGCICKLGEVCYQAHKAGEEFEAQELFHELELVDGILDKLTESLCQLKGIVICEKCGTEVMKGSAFCPSCGTQVRQPEVIRCPKCSAQLPGGSRFCVYCGAKVED